MTRSVSPTASLSFCLKLPQLVCSHFAWTVIDLVFGVAAASVPGPSLAHCWIQIYESFPCQVSHGNTTVQPVAMSAGEWI